jgi:hypothetical protein
MLRPSLTAVGAALPSPVRGHPGDLLGHLLECCQDDGHRGQLHRKDPAPLRLRPAAHKKKSWRAACPPCPWLSFER